MFHGLRVSKRDDYIQIILATLEASASLEPNYDYQVQPR